MKQTMLNRLHKEARAKMIEFAGFEMPVEFSGVKDEHMTVRNSVGVFDVSHMGEIWVKGPGAAALLQHVTTNDISILSPGQVQYTCFPNGRGGIVDDFLLYYYEPEKYMIVVNASNIEKDWNWLVSHNKFGAGLENASDRISLLAVQGPRAVDTLQKLTAINLKGMKYYSFKTDSLAGVDDVIISATGYTGSGGFELYFYNEYAEKIYKAVLEAGAEYGIKPVGLAARDTLRLEMGFCLYGNDIDDSTSPIEAGLAWITKFNDNNNFIDKEYLEAQKTGGTSRVLRGFELKDKGIPRHGYEIVGADGTTIGNVTSGTYSPMLEKGIGMGYIDKKWSAYGTEIYIKQRNKLMKSVVVKPPFI